MPIIILLLLNISCGKKVDEIEVGSDMPDCELFMDDESLEDHERLPPFATPFTDEEIEQIEKDGSAEILLGAGVQEYSEKGL